MRRLQLVVSLLVTLGVLALAPAALANDYVVTNAGDGTDWNAGDGTCETANGNGVCTLRAALAESAETSPNTITFDPSITSITVGSPLDVPSGTELDGCTDPAATAPCVELTSSILNFMLKVTNNGNIAISGFAFHAGVSRETSGILVDGGSSVRITNNWFGMRRSGVQSDLATAVKLLASDDVTVGGSTDHDRNVFVSSNHGVYVEGTGSSTIAGNRFSTNAAGSGMVQNATTVGPVDTAITLRRYVAVDQVTQSITIGGTLTAQQAATAACDGPCNVIGADSRGIDVAATATGEVQLIDVLGNHLGVLADGTTAITQTGTDAINVGAANTINVGNGGATGRNVVAGSWQNGIVDPDGLGTTNIRGNFVSIDATGTAELPVSVTGITVAGSGTYLSTVEDNRVAADPTVGVAMRVAGSQASVTGNTLGIGVGNEHLPMAGGMVVSGTANYVFANVVCGSRQSAAIEVQGTSNSFGENRLGVRGDGSACTGTSRNFRGYRIGGTASGNAIGQFEVNDSIISNSENEGILIDSTGDRNTVKLVRGDSNAEQFLDISSNSAGDGAGGGVGRNGSVARPTVGLAGTAGANGTGVAGAEIRIFQTTAAAGTTPRDIVQTLGYATVDGSGNWVAAYPATAVPVGSRITVLQTNSVGSSSELTDAKVTTDTTAPTAAFVSAPTGRIATATPTFTFTGSDESLPVTFRCGIDNAATFACSSPYTTPTLGEGVHTFSVFPLDAVGNLNTSPITRTITVDTVAPDTTLVTVPATKLASTTATVTFAGPTDAASFQCSLDGAAFATCTSPLALTGLSQGDHTFRARALDDVGNADATPASTTFTVDSVAPKLTFTPLTTWTVSTTGVTRPKLRCVDAHAPCTVKVTVTTRKKVVVGTGKPRLVTFLSSTVSVPGTATARSLTLSKAGAAALATLGGTAKVRASFVVTDAWGNVTRTSRLLTLAPVPPKRR